MVSDVGEWRGEADLEDEVGVGGRRDQLDVVPAFNGGVEGVVGIGAVEGEFLEGLEGEGVHAAIGDEDFVRGGDGGGDGRGRCSLLCVEDRQEREGSKKQGGPDDA
jgi:hypothetical protein